MPTEREVLRMSFEKLLEVQTEVLNAFDLYVKSIPDDTDGYQYRSELLEHRNKIFCAMMVTKCWLDSFPGR